MDNVALTFELKSIRPQLVVFCGVIRRQGTSQLFAEGKSCWVSTLDELSKEFDSWLDELKSSEYELQHCQALMIEEAKRA